MVILCGVCVWHSVVGAAAVHYVHDDDDDTDEAVTSSPPEMTSPQNASESTAEVCAAAAMMEEAMSEIVMADRLALAMFGSLYLLFHVVFVTHICASVCIFTHSLTRPHYSLFTSPF